MHCAACTLAVEQALQRVPGVKSVQVNGASATARVVWDAGRSRPSQWLASLRQSGYAAIPAGDLLDAAPRPAKESGEKITDDGAGGSDSIAVTVTIAAVNDAPVASGSAILSDILEDASSPSGATVSSLFAGNFSDSTDSVSGGSSANTLSGIAITSYTADAAKGNWQYTTNGTTWTTMLSYAISAAAQATLPWSSDISATFNATSGSATTGSFKLEAIRLLETGAGATGRPKVWTGSAPGAYRARSRSGQHPT